jgi:SulP family sulfate permease
VAAPLVSFVPLAALCAVLVVVAWNMAEKEAFRSILRSSRGDALVLLATFLLTVFQDLLVGIGVGVVLGSFLFLHRMAEAVQVQGGGGLMIDDQADSEAAHRADRPTTDPDVMVYGISGALFFGATAAVSTVLERVGRPPRLFVLDFSEVPMIDVTAAHGLASFVRKLRRSGSKVYFAGTRPSVRRVLIAAGLGRPDVAYAGTVAQALAAGKRAGG